MLPFLLAALVFLPFIASPEAGGEITRDYHHPSDPGVGPTPDPETPSPSPELRDEGASPPAVLGEEKVDDHITGEENWGNLTIRNNHLTRGEFGALLGEFLGLKPDVKADDGGVHEDQNKFPDLRNHPHRMDLKLLAERGIMPGYEDGSFRPDEMLTRGEMAEILARTVVLDSRTGLPNLEGTPEVIEYRDVDENHWAARGIRMAAHLGLMDAGEGDNFAPSRGVKPREAEEALSRLQRLTVLEGVISGVNPDLRTLELISGQGVYSLNVPDDTPVVRNSRVVSLENLEENDELRVVAHDDEGLIYLQAYGEISRDDLHSRLREVLGEAVTPELVTAVLNRDWDRARLELRPALTKQLVEMGLNQDEAELLIRQDWEDLDSTGRNTISRALAREFNVSQRAAEALLSGNWSELGAWLRIEALNRDYIGRASDATDGLLTPTQVAALLSGEWELVREGLEEELIRDLIDLGLDPEEAELMVNRNWEEVGRRERERIRAVIAEELGLEAEVIEALLERDWGVIQDAAQIHLVEYIMDILLDEEQA